MNPNHAKQMNRGLTVIEVLVCIAVVVLLGGFLIAPSISRAKAKAKRTHCISNLKQVGLSYVIWFNDHGKKFPWQATSGGTNGGTLEFALTGEVWRHFQAISNELNIPWILVCSADKERARVATWNSFTNNSHLSYFIGFDASEVAPHSILSGDRNLASSNRLLNGVTELTRENRLDWTTSIHNGVGNVVLADSSVQQANSGQLNSALTEAFLTTQSVLRFAFPQ